MNVSLVRRIGIACTTALGLMIGSAANAGETESGYSWSEILIPRIGPLGSAFNINDKGQVAVTNASGTVTGIYSHGIFTRLPAPPAGYNTLAAYGINNAGVVTGSALSAACGNCEVGFILTGKTYKFFAQQGFANTEPRAISNSGLITGYSYNDPTGAPQTTSGFVYNPAGAGTFTVVNGPEYVTGFSIVQGMNASGRITGDSRLADPTQRYGYVWQLAPLDNGALTLLPFLARFTIGEVGTGVRTAARGINDAGDITGYTSLGGTNVGFVGNDAKGFRLLVAPGGDGAGAITACTGINNARQVVCVVTDASNNNRDFIGTPDQNDQ
ncbi:MAG TPA: hypothetical protein VMT66_18290 [Steroidobacteraceae bacterium]|nr:hypothetical protein [Steroidobacteraceae bacterium]